ncbi:MULTISPECIES: phage major capsid protein [Stenotrophomonas]|uniref:Phage major capsid protein n=1 Tax=Stenotrophomonas lactitubi TaxID=2045214 RepID=A0AAW4GDB9_9GAMM|nr:MULTISPECIES: phage major capsid protein [Stenotrophomonas]MBM9912748.1 phage major capsid protein [Stenotrophomonas lactitubi]MBM9922235.1 phage major capsid protein [Stenotrophomonas lactitubi]MBM9939794.1 phage major capsid protein [Stenotrophomonas lactitubi]
MTKPTKIARGIQAVRAEGEPTDVAGIVAKLNEAFDQFKAKHTADVDAVRQQVDENSTALAAWQMNGGGSTDAPAADLDGGGIKVLRTPADFRAHYASRRDADDKPRAGDTTLTDFMRGVAGMSSTEAVMASLAVGTDSAGGYAVPDVVMPGILSALVPASSLLQAGAGIVPMGYGAKSVSTAAIDTLPTATWRNELGNISESEPTLRSVQSTPRSLACIVRVSRELLADGSDVDRALRQVIAQAFAKELDRVGLLGTAPEPRGLRNTPGINTVSMGANGAALASFRPLLNAYGSIIDVNAPAPTAAIMATRTLMDFEGLTDTTGQPLQRPRLIDDMSFVPTSQLPTDVDAGTSDDASEIFVGNFNGLYFLMREALSVQLLREAYAKTGEIGFLCHMRADVVINYPQQFTVITGVRPAAE